MKLQLFVFALVVAGTYAMPPASDVAVVARLRTTSKAWVINLNPPKPDSPNQRAPRFVVESQIRRAVDQISQEIRNAGLDPLVIEHEEFVYRPIPFFVQVNAFIKDLTFSGASDIRVHSINYNLLLNRLSFDISLARLTLTVGDSGIQASIFSKKFEGQLNGRLLIRSIRLSGDIRVNIGIISGISLHSVSLNLRLGGIRSILNLSAQGVDLSDSVNNILNESIPKAFEDNRVNINTRLENIVKEVFERFL